MLASTSFKQQPIPLPIFIDVDHAAQGAMNGKATLLERMNKTRRVWLCEA